MALIMFGLATMWAGLFLATGNGWYVLPQLVCVACGMGITAYEAWRIGR